MPNKVQVLVVDDELDLSELTKEFLEMRGDMHLECVSSVREALTKIAKNHYDAIVSDYQMPMEDGIQFLKLLRGAGDKTPFVLFTGKGREEVVIEALNNGADAYLQKGGQPLAQYAELGHRIMSLVGRHRAEELLSESEFKLQHAEDVTGFGNWQMDLGSMTISMSHGTMMVCGLATNNLSIAEWQGIILPEYRSSVERSLQELIDENSPYNLDFKVCRPNDGRIIVVHAMAEYDPDKKIVFGVLQDITALRREARYREIVRSILQILTQPGTLERSLQQVISSLKASLGVDAVGMRLKLGDDFPYYSQEGFSKEFISKENSLFGRGQYKDIGLVANCQPNLECTCGLVVSGRTDPSNPLFTRGGSAWTSDSFPLLHLPPNEDPRTSPRNECIHQGYATIVLTPIRSNGKIIGLLQFNDRRKCFFSLDDVESLEVIADNIGVALLRKKAEEALKETESRYRGLFHNIPVAVVLKRNICNETGEVIDRVLIDANQYALEALGVSSIGDMEDKGPGGLFSPETTKMMIDNVRKLKGIGRSFTEEIHLDANNRDYLTTFIPLENDYTITASLDITERKRAVEALEKSEERYRNLMDKAPDAILVHRYGEVLYANAAALDLYRADTLDNLTSHNILDLIPSEDLRDSLDRIKEIEVCKKLPPREANLIDLHGKTVSVEVISSSIEYKNHIAIQSIIRDISERKKGDLALRESESRYRGLFEMIDEGFCIIEKVDTTPNEPSDYRYLEVNPAFSTSTGIAEVVGKTIREIVPDEPEEWFVTYDDVLRAGKPIRFERSLVTRGRFLDLYAFPIESEHQKKVAVIFKDITQRKEFEETLKISESKYRYLFEKKQETDRLVRIIESTDDAVVGKDLNGTVTSWNKGAESIYGYNEEEMVGNSIFILAAPDSKDDMKSILSRVGAGESINHYETSRITKDGRRIYISLTVSPVRDDHGMIVGASTIARDITERKRIEEALNWQVRK